MKAITYFTLLFMIAFNAAGQEYSLNGIWTVDFDKTLTHMDRQSRLKYDDLPEKTKGNMREAFDGRIFNLKNDNIVEVSFKFQGATRRIDGTFDYNHSSRILKIMAQDKTTEYLLLWDASGEIQLVYKDAMAQGVLKLLYLTRK